MINKNVSITTVLFIEFLLDLRLVEFEIENDFVYKRARVRIFKINNKLSNKINTNGITEYRMRWILNKKKLI